MSSTTELENLIRSGNRLEDSGEPAAALEQYELAARNHPDSSRVQINRGNVLASLGRPKEASQAYQRAIALDPNSPAPHMNLGNLMAAAGHHRAAVASYRRAAALRSDWAEPWVGIGCAEEQGNNAELAIAAYRQALQLDSEHVGAAANLALLLLARGEVAEARDLLLSAARLDSRQPLIPHGLARIQVLEKDYAAGAASYQRAYELAPSELSYLSDRLFTLTCMPGVDPQKLAQEHFAYGALLESRIAQMALLPPQNSGRIRIGYLSPDFRRHPVSVFVRQVLEHHSREHFEVHCFQAHRDADEVTRELRTLADHWHEIHDIDDESAATLIAEQSIDILVDLAGHTAGNRLALFARKPAPLQITWLGYLGTTGLKAMDYRICDASTDPIGATEAHHSEALLRMPHSQWCYRPAIDPPSPTELPRLLQGRWTFGSFNQYAKINSAVLETWAALLHAVPDSQLRIVGLPNDFAATWIETTLAGHGIASGRLEMMKRVPINHYFQAIASVDIALDSFPYNGGTTTFDALICGVPVLCMAGDRSIARGSLSILRTLHLEEWIVASRSDYPQRAKQLCKEPAHIARLRSELPSKLRASPLMDGRRFTHDLEQALIQIRKEKPNAT